MTEMNTLESPIKGIKSGEDYSASVMSIEIGPAHPAMHGIVRFTTHLDGEVIVGMDPEIGYLHRGFEKESENSKWIQVIPYTDRLNYVSPLLNNIGYSMAVEKLYGIEAPRRAEFTRVIMGEISRITDHLTCLGAVAMEIGAFTFFVILFHSSPEEPAPSPALPFTELTCKIISTFRSVSGAVQTTVQLV